MRPHSILPVACVALLTIGSTATGPTGSRPARIGMLCATVCPTVVLDELRQLGWVEGSTILIDRKPAASRLERLPQLAKELVQSKPDLIIATSSQPVRAAKDATTEIPIVMLYVADPVGVGLAQSLARPGGEPDRRNHSCAGWHHGQKSAIAERASANRATDRGAHQPNQ